MTELLLNSAEALNFCDLKASWRSKKINNEINTLNNEIKDAISKGTIILNDNNSSINFILELVNLDEQISSSNTDEKEELVLKRDRLASSFNEFILSLSLNTREDLEFIVKQINDRKDAIAALKKTLEEIKEKYPNVDSVNRGELFDKIPILGQINAYHNSEVVDKKDEKVDEALQEEEVLPKLKNNRFVVRIKKASEELVNLVSKDELIKPVVNQDIVTSVDNSFFGNTDDNSLLSEIKEDAKITPKTTEDEKTEEIYVSEKPEFRDDEVTDLSDSSTYNFADISLEELNTPVSDSKEVSSEEVKYTMNKGDTLSNIALTLYGDENAWYDIFNANNEVLTSRLSEQLITDTSSIENNSEIFAGIELSLPNEYTKSSNNDMKLAA